MSVQEKKEVERRPRLLKFMDSLSFKKIFFFWVLSIAVFGALYFAAGPAKDAESLKDSAFSAFMVSILGSNYGTAMTGSHPEMIVLLQTIASLFIYALVIARLINVKQDATLEEVKNIGFEDNLDKLRSGLYLFRSDITRALEKIESGTLKARELRDMWIMFSGLDTSITNIKDFIIPRKNDDRHRKVDIFRFELLLNSIKLSMSKTLELIKALKNHHFDWRNELMLTSIYYDVRVAHDIINFSVKRTEDKKVIDRLNELRIVLDSIETEIKSEQKEIEEEQPPQNSQHQAHDVQIREEHEHKHEEQGHEQSHQEASSAGRGADETAHEQPQHHIESAPQPEQQTHHPHHITISEEDGMRKDAQDGK